MKLTDAQWEIVESLLPEPKAGDGRRGRPPHSFPDVLDGILWAPRGTICLDGTHPIRRAIGAFCSYPRTGNPPPRLIGDKAWNSRKHARLLDEERNIELIAAVKAHTQSTATGRSPSPALPTTLESGASLCLAKAVPVHRDAMGTQVIQLSRLPTTRLHRYHASAFLSCALILSF